MQKGSIRSIDSITTMFMIMHDLYCTWPCMAEGAVCSDYTGYSISLAIGALTIHST